MKYTIKATFKLFYPNLFISAQTQVLLKPFLSIVWQRMGSQQTQKGVFAGFVSLFYQLQGPSGLGKRGLRGFCSCSASGRAMELQSSVRLRVFLPCSSVFYGWSLNSRITNKSV